MSKQIVLNDYLEFKKGSVKTENKLKDIERYVKRFIESNNKQLDEFQESDLNKFLNSLNFKTNTLNGVKDYLKNFIKWYYPDYPSRFRTLDKILKRQDPGKTYEPEQMKTEKDIKELIKQEDDLMWKCYWALFFWGGFRPKECAELLWNQVYFEDKGVIIKIVVIKGDGKPKTYYKSIPKWVEPLLKKWKEYNTSEYLFPSSHPTRKDKPILVRSVWLRLQRLSKKVFGESINPYIIRHSFGTIIYNKDNLKDEIAANQMGHGKSMKEVYTNLDEGKLKARARKIWSKGVQLTDTEREELEKRIEAIEKDNAQLREFSKNGIKQILDMISKKSMVELEEEFGIINRFPPIQKLVSKK